MKQRAQKLIDRIDALPSRDRAMVAAGLLAAVVGIEMMVLLPLADKRVAIAASVQAQSAAEIDAQNAALEERTQRLTAATERLKQLDERLVVLGVHSVQRDALNGFVRRALPGRGVVLTGLRALPVESLDIAPPVAEAAPADAAAAPAAPSAVPKLYRHRAELVLEGAAAEVAQSVGVLEQGLKPLRVEQVQLSADPLGGPVRARLVFTTISPEATWLAL